LVVNLVETRREGGKIKSAHIARLGSVALPEPIEAGVRILFWADLKDRWRDIIDRLGNRVSADDRKKALAAIHARIPKPSEAELQAARAEGARAVVSNWEGLRGLHTNSIERERKHIASAEKRIAEEKAAVDALAPDIYDAQRRALKVFAGERIKDDDDLALDHLWTLEARRARAIREAPRPAARGRRGRQKRPRWSKVAERI
jgi:hypothetical protein